MSPELSRKQLPTSNKKPRTERGRRTLRSILEAAASEFGEKGFHEASITGITRRAGVALGSFYTYFDTKDAVFKALVKDMSERVRDHVAPALATAPNAIAAEQIGLQSFLEFAQTHKEIYRIIDEAEFVDNEDYRKHYSTTAARIMRRLQDGAARGEIRPDVSEIHAWAIMGMNVFLGLRYCVWADDIVPGSIAGVIGDFLEFGISPTKRE